MSHFARQLLAVALGVVIALAIAYGILFLLALPVSISGGLN